MKAIMIIIATDDYIFKRALTERSSCFLSDKLNFEGINVFGFFGNTLPRELPILLYLKTLCFEIPFDLVLLLIYELIR